MDWPPRRTVRGGGVAFLVPPGEYPVGSHEQRPFARPFYTPYWTTFELAAIDMKAASIGMLDQIATGLRWRSLRETRGGSPAAEFTPRPGTLLNTQRSSAVGNSAPRLSTPV